MSCGVFSFVCDVAGGAVSSVASSGFDAIAQSFGEAAKTVTNWMWSAISQTTTVDLSGDWFTKDLAITVEIALVMISGLFVLQLIKGVLLRDPRALGRAVTGCAIAFLGAAVAITVTMSLLALTDHLADGIVKTAGLGDIQQMGPKLADLTLLSGNAFTPGLVIVLALGYLLASILVWAVFVTRKALIIVAALFSPIAFGGAAADATRAWVRKWIEFTVAMVFSKIAIVLIFTIAVSMLGPVGSGAAGLSNLLTGLLLLVLACFAPWAVFKLIHFVGGDIIAAHHTAAVAHAQEARQTVQGTAQKLKGTAEKVLGTGAAGAATGSAARAAGGSGVPATAVVATSGVGRRVLSSTPGSGDAAVTGLDDRHTTQATAAQRVAESVQHAFGHPDGSAPQPTPAPPNPPPPPPPVRGRRTGDRP